MISKKLTENRIELLELLKKMSKLAEEIEDQELRAQVGQELNEAFLVCLRNAELMSDRKVIEAFYLVEKEDSIEETELQEQAQTFKDFTDTVSSDYLVKWINANSYKA